MKFGSKSWIDWSGLRGISYRPQLYRYRALFLALLVLTFDATLHIVGIFEAVWPIVRVYVEAALGTIKSVFYTVALRVLALERMNGRVGVAL